jgi:hypothetical protein
MPSATHLTTEASIESRVLVYVMFATEANGGTNVRLNVLIFFSTRQCSPLGSRAILSAHGQYVHRSQLRKAVVGRALRLRSDTACETAAVSLIIPKIAK